MKNLILNPNPSSNIWFTCLTDPGRPGAFFFYSLENHKKAYLYMAVLQAYSGIKYLVSKDMRVAGHVLEIIHEDSGLINYN